MSELVQMRQRIKAIETIKKITHAMRLISMSSQLRLKSKQKNLTEYVASIDSLFFKIQAQSTTWKHPVLNPANLPQSKKLVILVGSQKGLCGNFNNVLFKSFSHHITVSDAQKIDIIAVGKKIGDFCQEQNLNNVIATHSNFSMNNIQALTNIIASAIMHAKQPYSSVVIWSNKLKNFFSQKPHETNLIPFSVHPDNDQATSKSCEEYIWHQSSQEILNALATQYIEAHVYQTLFESLLAEHAARFISMDGSTRNAQDLLETNKRAYNKARQAKITKELTELSSSF